MPIAEVDHLDGLLVIGANLRREVPVLAHRVRKAALAGAAVAFVNPATFDYKFKVAGLREVRSGGAGRAIWRRCWRPWPRRRAPRIPAHLSAVAAGATCYGCPPGHRRGACCRDPGAPCGSGRWRCVIRSMPTCAPWPAPLRSWPAPRWANWPKAAMPPGPTSLVACRIARPAARRWRRGPERRADAADTAQGLHPLRRGRARSRQPESRKR